MTAALHALPCRNPSGAIEVWPVEDDGGSWGVVHIALNGVETQISTSFAFDDAMVAARAEAARRGADFLDGLMAI